MALAFVTKDGGTSLVAKVPRMTDRELYDCIEALRNDNASLRLKVAALEAWKARVKALAGKYAIRIAEEINR